jgi:nicotinate-nucleotide adenylyltransferase
MNVALFGTSADPPTPAHQQVINWLGQRFDQVALWAADNPDKHHGATLAQRMEMLGLLVAELALPQVRVYPHISDRYTFNTLALARSIWPEARFALVIGSDLLGQIDHWHRAQELLAQVDLWVIPRPGWPTQDCQYYLVTDLATYDLSSTALRTAIGQGELGGLSAAVRNYITTNGLYGFPPSYSGEGDHTEP